MKKLIIIMTLLTLLGCSNIIMKADPTFDPVKAEQVESWFDFIFDWFLIFKF